MALATKCPQCGALFRVVADQLKLRGGLVRCGQCRAVFDAIGSLTYVDDSALAQARTNGTPPRSKASQSMEDSAAAGVATRQSLGPSTTLRISPVAPATLAGVVLPRAEPEPKPPEDPAALRRRAKAAARARSGTAEAATEPAAPQSDVPTLVAPNEASTPAGDSAPEEVEVIEPAPALPDGPGDTAADEEESPPTFARRKRATPRGFSIVFSIGSLLLAALAAIQLAVIFRAELMIHWPQSRLVLMDLCGVFRCTVNWPTRADQLAVISSELQAVPGTNALELTAVVRNRAGYRQSLPAVEVTLTDSRNRAVARKVFSPADYLASAGEVSARIQDGLGPGSDYTIRIFFEARGVQPAGFLVYPFFL
jgi:predicted Zn finger-like uncharacterized protein